MIFYSGDEQQYLTRIFLNDPELKDVFYNYHLYSSDELIASAVAEAITNTISVRDLEKCLSASEIYDTAIEAYASNKTSNQFVLLMEAIEQSIFDVYYETFLWYMDENKQLYMGILKSLIYGSLKHFFHENRHKYLPQYDWYLIEQEANRKVFVDTLFKEFDKLSTVVDSIKNYTDIDEIPDKFLIYLMELIGTTVNDYNGVLTDKQIRSMAKNLIDTYRYKGSLFAFELFFGCIGIDAQVDELYFDRRRYYNSGVKNEYTLTDSKGTFEFYLTPRNPVTTSYSFYSGENPKFNSLTYPISSSVWNNSFGNATYYTLTTDTKFLADKTYYRNHGGSYLEMKAGVDYTIGGNITAGEVYEYNDDTDKVILSLLDFSDEKEVSEKFTYFKSNVISIKFYNYISDELEVSRDELAVYQQLIQQIIPAFVQTVYRNTYDTSNVEEEYFVIAKELFIDSNKYSLSTLYGVGVITNANLCWVEKPDTDATEIINNLFASSHDDISHSGKDYPELNTEMEFTAETKGKDSGEVQFTFDQTGPHLFESAIYTNNIDITKSTNSITYKLNNWTDDNKLCTVISNLTKNATLKIEDN